LYLFNLDPVPVDRLLNLNKYWVLFGSMVIADTFGGFILHSIPGYFYLKIGFIYALIRNNYALTGTVFSGLETLYVTSNLRPMIDRLIQRSSSKLDGMKVQQGGGTNGADNKWKLIKIPQSDDNSTDTKVNDQSNDTVPLDPELPKNDI